MRILVLFMQPVSSVVEWRYPHLEQIFHLGLEASLTGVARDLSPRRLRILPVTLTVLTITALQGLPGLPGEERAASSYVMPAPATLSKNTAAVFLSLQDSLPVHHLFSSLLSLLLLSTGFLQ